MKSLQTCIKTAEEQSLRERAKEIKQPYISNKTFELIKQRQLERDKKNLAAEWALSKRIKNAIRRDKRRYWAEQLEKEDWKEVKSTKKPFMPRQTKIRDKKGLIVTSEKRPDVLADHFESVQWGKTIPEEKRKEHATRKEFQE